MNLNQEFDNFKKEILNNNNLDYSKELKTKLLLELKKKYTFKLTFKDNMSLILYTIFVGLMGISNIIDSINTGERIYIVFNIINGLLLLIIYYATNKIMRIKFLIRQINILDMLCYIEAIENEVKDQH